MDVHLVAHLSPIAVMAPVTAARAVNAATVRRTLARSAATTSQKAERGAMMGIQLMEMAAQAPVSSSTAVMELRTTQLKVVMME